MVKIGSKAHEGETIKLDTSAAIDDSALFNGPPDRITPAAKPAPKVSTKPKAVRAKKPSSTASEGIDQYVELADNNELRYFTGRLRHDREKENSIETVRRLREWCDWAIAEPEKYLAGYKNKV